MLTDTKCRTAKVGKHSDGHGLLLAVSPAGSRVWRWRYSYGGKEQVLTIGRYPEVGLAAARAMREEADTQRRNGIDPGRVKKQAKQARMVAQGDTFEIVAREWYERQKVLWTPVHADNVITSLGWVFPDLGDRPIGEITPKQVLAALRKIEDRPAIETAKRVRQRMSAVFQYAIAADRATIDPAAQVGKALKPLVKGQQPAIVDLPGVRKIIATAEAIPAHPPTRLALRLLALTALRPGEVRKAKIDEFHDLDGPEPTWHVPGERMKMKRDHLVPLSAQAVETIKTAIPLAGADGILFPSPRKRWKPISENAIGHMLNRAGYGGEHVPHGFRASFSTIMRERDRTDNDVIELMLSHVQQDRSRGPYDRAEHLPRRRELGQLWADLILEGRPPAGELIKSPRR